MVFFTFYSILFNPSKFINEVKLRYHATRYIRSNFVLLPKFILWPSHHEKKSASQRTYPSLRRHAVTQRPGLQRSLIHYDLTKARMAAMSLASYQDLAMK